MFTQSHPTYEEYVRTFEAMLKLITKENIQSLIVAELYEFKEKLDSLGVINLIYQLDTSDGRYILRVSNPHPFWRGYAKDNHIAFLNLVKGHIPTCEVLTHGSFMKGEAGFEYIIFREVINYTTLSDYLEKLGEEFKSEYIWKIQQELLLCVRYLQSIEVPQLIGSLKKDGFIGLIHDGPRVGPHPTLQDHLYDIVQWAQTELSPLNDSELQHKIDLLKVKISKVQNPQLYLSHQDLNASNILVNKQGEILAILDWDSACIFPPQNDIEYIESYADHTSNEREIKAKFQEQVKNLGIAQINEETSQVIHLVDMLKWCCFWVNTWHPYRNGATFEIRVEQLKKSVEQGRFQYFNDFDLQL